MWGNFINHYGKRGCVIDKEQFPPPTAHKKQGKLIENRSEKQNL